MDIREIRASGILEQYALGNCSKQEVEIVEQALIDFPELKKDLYEIGNALEQYAKQFQVEPSGHLKNELIKSATNSNNPIPPKTDISNKAPGNRFPSWLTGLLALGCLGLSYLYFSNSLKQNALQSEYDNYKILCDSIQAASDIQYALIEDLQNPNNQILALGATPKYSETELFLIYNSVDQKNYLQVQNLPTISNQQSYQLWSLKAGVDPIPLTVFQGDEGVFIPVDFEDGTATYAITIEPFGGVQSPTLDDLIGTVNVPS